MRAAAPRALVCAHAADAAWIEDRELILRERYGWYDGVRRSPTRRTSLGWLRDAMGADVPVDSGSGRRSVPPRPASSTVARAPPARSHAGPRRPLGAATRGPRSSRTPCMARGLLDTEGNVIHPPPVLRRHRVRALRAAAAALRPARLLTAHYDVIEGDDVDRFLDDTIDFVRAPVPRSKRCARRAIRASRSPSCSTGGRRARPVHARCRTSSPRPCAACLRGAGRRGAMRLESRTPALALAAAWPRRLHAEPAPAESVLTSTPSSRQGGPMELGMISSTWLGTKVGRLEGIRQAKEIGFDTYDIFEDPLDLTDAEREEIKNDVRGGRPPDPVGRLRRLRSRRLQPVGAALHARPHQGLRRPGRLPRRPQRAARRRRVLLGRRGLPARGDLGHGQGGRQERRRVRGLEGTRDRARARAVQRRRCSRTSTSSSASSRRSTIRPSARTPTSRTSTSRTPPSTTSRS